MEGTGSVLLSAVEGGGPLLRSPEPRQARPRILPRSPGEMVPYKGCLLRLLHAALSHRE